MKRQAILQNLQKLDNQTDPETYHALFELSMAEGLIPTREWNQLLRKQTVGRAAEVFQELDGTMPYPEFKALMLERLGCTCVKARQTVWKNQPLDHQSPRAHLTPIIRGINPLTNNLKDTTEFLMEMFQGVLTLYYSAEVCHSLKGKDFNNM